ncbi:C2 domain containing protein [Klebsormidium nitens]|uniref:C2 domain containing protein n=1 Tax=Klebsormidium nitens TaxID=105231 RepID=A0A1Y1HU76_KLENI|nr:C2 domain containing protein [Klebsormidium nitens]|eukprot:GAQ82174.1 C2 domain containing protein [Klebsormidium nitens]
MATKAGNLQVSVVEGKGLKAAGGAASADPYVRLTLGTQEVRTDALKGTLAPKWVKDFKLPVPVTKPNLVVAIGDDASKQDIGSTTIQIADIIAAGTTVHWYKVQDAAGAEAGEVCLVLRFIAPKDSVRSPSPSITSSDARSPASSISSVPDSIANGNGAVVGGTTGPSLTVSPSVKEAIQKIENNDPSGAEKLTQIATRDPPKEVIVKEEVFAEPAVVKQEVIVPETTTTYTAPPPPPHLEQANGVKEEAKPKPRKSKKKGSPLGSLLGGALAIAAGAFVVANSKRKPKFYEVKEGDTLCSIAGCFRLSVDELYDHNIEVTQDPDRIYPGDKFYIP